MTTRAQTLTTDPPRLASRPAAPAPPTGPAPGGSALAAAGDPAAPQAARPGDGRHPGAVRGLGDGRTVRRARAGPGGLPDRVPGRGAGRSEPVRAHPDRRALHRLA